MGKVTKRSYKVRASLTPLLNWKKLSSFASDFSCLLSYWWSPSEVSSVFRFNEDLNEVI